MNFIINIVVFILSLSMLVVIHELGHFLTAKLFGVYCREFSLGMGPLIFKYKGKNKETQFSIRAIPLGGFVSMVGEDAGDSELIGGQKDPNAIEEKELTEEEKIILSLPKERRLDGIAKWKRAIIMAAGVVMNMILAIVLFLITNANIRILDESKRGFAIVEENSVVERANITSQDVFKFGKYDYKITILNEQKENVLKEGTVEKEINDGNDLYDLINVTFNLKKGESLNLQANDVLSYTLITDKNEERKFELKTLKNENDENYSFQKFGVGFFTRHYTFSETFSHTFQDVGESSVAIVKALGTLFTKDGIQQVGGPVAIFQLSAQYSAMGFEYYCLLWGLISVNLAVMNFLPFPGLDGWHFLVLIVEGVTKKEMPSKVKNIVSTIGLMLLFGLMILVTFKDIIGLF